MVSMLQLITGSQIRMARAYLRWSIQHLADLSGIGTTTLKRMEAVDGLPEVSAVKTRLVQQILTKELDNRGLELTLGNGFGPGIRHREPME